MQERPHIVARWWSIVIWGAMGVAMLGPIAVAATSPYLASRDFAYAGAGFAGVICLSLLFVQPLLAVSYLPGFPLNRARRWHRWTGVAIMLAVFLHVAGLYLTSPPDTLDVLLLRSPTSFSVFGVIAMWSIFLTGLLVFLRQKLRLRYPVWHITHNVIAIVAVGATVIHALQIVGTMGFLSKLAICILVVLTTLLVLVDVRVLRRTRRTIHAH